MLFIRIIQYDPLSNPWWYQAW